MKTQLFRQLMIAFVVGGTATLLTSCDSTEVESLGAIEVSHSALSKLLYAPPSYTSTQNISNTGSAQTITLNNNTSYRLVLPGTAMSSSLKVRGGKNIVIIGGAFAIDQSTTAALVIEDNGNTTSRTIHVEGVKFNMSNAYGRDAIRMAAPKGHFQFENVRVEQMDGQNDNESQQANARGCTPTFSCHADAIQNVGGAASVKVHKMTVETNYQGFWLTPTLGGVTTSSLNVKEVDFFRPSSVLYEFGNPIFLMMTQQLNNCATYTSGATISDVYFLPTLTFGVKHTSPDVNSPTACQAEVNFGNWSVFWPGTTLSGAAFKGPVPGGSFVSTNVAGLNYNSPGDY